MPFCPNCGKEIQAESTFCPSCGFNLKGGSASKPATTMPMEHKSPGVAAVLALVLGIFGIMGIGHIYVGRLGRGIGLLIVGIILGAITWGSFLLGFITLGAGFMVGAFFGLILFILWIWQTYNAYSLAKYFNRTVQETGKAPW